MKLRGSLLAIGLVAGCHASPPALDHADILARQSWWDNRDWDWYEQNIPFFESPIKAPHRGCRVLVIEDGIS